MMFMLGRCPDVTFTASPRKSWRMPRSPKKPAILRTISSNPGIARSVLRAARSAGCSHERDEIWTSGTRFGIGGGVRDANAVRLTETTRQRRLRCRGTRRHRRRGPLFPNRPRPLLSAAPRRRFPAPRRPPPDQAWPRTPAPDRLAGLRRLPRRTTAGSARPTAPRLLGDPEEQRRASSPPAG